jgi:hypothetical protein
MTQGPHLVLGAPRQPPEVRVPHAVALRATEQRPTVRREPVRACLPTST